MSEAERQAQARRERAARTLRENLQRRKQQGRARRAGDADEAVGLPAARGEMTVVADSTIEGDVSVVESTASADAVTHLTVLVKGPVGDISAGAGAPSSTASESRCVDDMKRESDGDADRDRRADRHPAVNPDKSLK